MRFVEKFGLFREFYSLLSRCGGPRPRHFQSGPFRLGRLKLGFPLLRLARPKLLGDAPRHEVVVPAIKLGGCGLLSLIDLAEVANPPLLGFVLGGAQGRGDASRDLRR